jgi:hypothetical protein
MMITEVSVFQADVHHQHEQRQDQDRRWDDHQRDHRIEIKSPPGKPEPCDRVSRQRRYTVDAIRLTKVTFVAKPCGMFPIEGVTNSAR